MQVTAIYESWHIEDGNYPPLSRGELVRLSFELERTSLTPHRAPPERRLEHLGDAEYRGFAQVLSTIRSKAIRSSSSTPGRSASTSTRPTARR
jgi:hypothetical protein